MCRKKNDTDPVLQAVLVDKKLRQTIESIRSKKDLPLSITSIHWWSQSSYDLLSVCESNYFTLYKVIFSQWSWLNGQERVFKIFITVRFKDLNSMSNRCWRVEEWKKKSTLVLMHPSFKCVVVTKLFFSFWLLLRPVKVYISTSWRKSTSRAERSSF